MYRLNTKNAGRKAAPDRRGAVARGALFEARAARGVSERRAVRRQHPGRRRREPHLFRQVAGSPDARRVADARGDSAASGQPRRPAASEPSLLAARAQLGRLWLAHHGNDADDRRQIELPIVAAPAVLDAVAGASSSSTPCWRAGARPAARIDTTIDAEPAAAGRAADRALPDAARRRAASATPSSLLVDTRDMSVKAWVGSADYWNARHRRPGQRRARQAIAGLDAEAVRLRAGARSGRAASADDAARRADVVRSVHAGELRRPLLRSDQRRGRADSQPQHSGGVGRPRS